MCGWANNIFNGVTGLPSAPRRAAGLFFYNRILGVHLECGSKICYPFIRPTAGDERSARLKGERP